MRRSQDPMSAKNPEPLTPEGKRAAARVRMIFFSIAAANIVLIAIVMWSRRNADKKDGGVPAKPAAAESAGPARGK